MKISLRVTGISIVLWFGLGIGLANAAASIATSLGSQIDATATTGSGFAAFTANYTAVDYLDSANTVTAVLTKTNTASYSDTAESIPAGPSTIQTLGSMNKTASRAVDAGNSAQISTHQTYAMLLVGLGMLFFSARQRSKVA